MEIVLIAAMAANRVIGRDMTIPWHIPGEQKRFRETTLGHALIMGRKTHESIGRPLPGRRNIVVTRSPDYRAPDCDVVHSLAQAYSMCREEQRVFNIGGEQLYRQGLAHADSLVLTILEEAFEGDAYFPEFAERDFQLTEVETIFEPVPYTIETYRRRISPG